MGEWQTEGPSIYLRSALSGGRVRAEPPNTKFVWVAASGDKMAISTISQPSISFQQIEALLP